MRRRDLLALLAPRVDYRDYSRVLPDYLTRLATESYERRNRALGAVKTPAEARKRQKWAREMFWTLTGGELERTPLRARVTGRFEREQYRVEKLVYESRPEFHIAANLYVPKFGKGPYPAVLFQMGHALNGKASPFYQYCCQGLAQLGFVVLAFDPMGQGERTYYPRAGGVLTRLASADDEHTLPGKQLILTGDTATRLQVWDAMRSLDYLAGHPLVDPKRIASTGNSGGGTLTMLLAAVDDRLACAAVCLGNTENHACAKFNSPGSTDDAEQNFLYGGEVGFDRWDTLYPMAPKPLLIQASAKDAFGTYSPRYIENGREEFEKLQRIYSILGRREDVEWYESPLPHALSYHLRMGIYGWFRRHLQGINEPLEQEPPVKAEADETLYVSATGNMVRDLGGQTPLSLARTRLRQIEKPSGVVDLKRLLRLDEPLGRLAVKGKTESRGVSIEGIEVESTAGVWVPAWRFRPRKGPATARMILLDVQGRNGRWNEDGLCQQLAVNGWDVCTMDVRGIGDLRPEFPRQAPGHGSSHQEEEAYAWASMMLGKPLIGQRVTDLLAVRKALGNDLRTVLVASGDMVFPAIFATALDEGITKVAHVGELPSYRGVLDREEYALPFAHFLFGVLKETDLPEVSGGMAGRVVALGRGDMTAAQLGKL